MTAPSLRSPKRRDMVFILTRLTETNLGEWDSTTALTLWNLSVYTYCPIAVRTIHKKCEQAGKTHELRTSKQNRDTRSILIVFYTLLLAFSCSMAIGIPNILLTSGFFFFLGCKTAIAFTSDSSPALLNSVPPLLCMHTSGKQNSPVS